MTDEQIENEARACYEDYRAAKPRAVGGALVPAWEDNYMEEVKDAWRAVARGVLARHGRAPTGQEPWNPPPYPPAKPST